MRHWAIALMVLLGAVSCMQAMADGCKMPSLVVREIPAIPEQRAVLVFKDAEETLIIESSLDGKGDEFAWIIPVPAKPTAFAEVSPGLVLSMIQSLQPRVYDREFGGAVPHRVGLLIFTILWAFIVVPMYRYWGVAGTVITSTLILLLAWKTLPPGLFDTKHAPRAAGEPQGIGVAVEETVEIGSYELAVLNAESGEALNAWLSANGFVGIPDSGASAVADYVNKGWRFVAAKLRRDGEGFSRPHPISIAFPASEPVYPMRLTALAGSDLYLQIFVVADSGANCSPLALEYVDQFRHGEVHFQGYYYSPLFSRAEPQDEQSYLKKALLGNNFYHVLGHPTATEVFWDGCVISKLSGTLRPRAMALDLYPELGDWHPYRQSFYTAQAIRQRALVWGLSACSALLVPAVLGLLMWATTSQRISLWFKFVLPCTAAAGIVTAQVIAYSSPAAEAHGIHAIWNHESRARFPLAEVVRAYDGFKGWTAEEIESCLRFEVKREQVYGQRGTIPLAVGDIPGGVEVLRGEGLVFRIFDPWGVPEELVIDPNRPNERMARSTNAGYFFSRHHEMLEALTSLGSQDERGIEALTDALNASFKQYGDWRAERAVWGWFCSANADHAKSALQTLVGQPFGRASFLVADSLRVAHPDLTASACLDALAWLRSERPEDTDSLLLCVCVLARTLRIPPPPSVSDAAALDAFIERATSRANAWL